MKIRFKKNVPEGVNTQSDQEFIVVGIRILKTNSGERECIQFVFNDNGNARMHYSSEMELLDLTQNKEWVSGYQKATEYDFGVTTEAFVIGYEELVKNPRHYVDLCEYKKDALQIFNGETPDSSTG